MGKTHENLERPFFLLAISSLILFLLSLFLFLVIANPIAKWDYWYYSAAAREYYQNYEFDMAFNNALSAKKMNPSDQTLDQILLFSHFKNPSLKLPPGYSFPEKNIVYGPGWTSSPGDSIVGKSFFWTDSYSLALVKDMSPCQELAFSIHNPTEDQVLLISVSDVTTIKHYPIGFFNFTITKENPSPEGFFLVELSSKKYRTCADDPDVDCAVKGIRVLSFDTYPCNGG